MKLKWLHFADVAEIQEAVTDELKKVQKRGVFGGFSEIATVQKLVYMPLVLNLNKKERYVSLIFKKISPKTFGPHCVCVLVT